MLSIPNIPHSSVPTGTDEKDNVEVRKWGTVNKPSFNQLSHWELAVKNDLIDFIFYGLTKKTFNMQA
jgi:seryl-tRNA synthetase